MPEQTVDVSELATWLASATPPTLLDVRWRLGGPPGVEAFRAGHLPGAAYADLERDLSAPPAADRSGGRHPLPDP
ncbi:MAG: sulfurtransferase, partial [Actinomycetes bacterium]